MGLFSSWFKKGTDSKEQAPALEPEAAQETVEELAGALAGADGAARIDAARVLLDRWRAGDGEAAAAIVARVEDLLEDPEPQVRIAALGAVRMMRKPENLTAHASAVLALLADPVAQVRTAAVWTAARLPGPAAREQVRALLASGEEPMRFAAACALSDQGDGAALPQLVAALREDYRRQEALSALMSLGDPAAVPGIAELFEGELLGELDRTLAAAALARLGDARGAAHLVLRVASDGDDRPIAAEWAGRLRIAEAVPALEELAAADGEPARGAALRALGRLAAPGVEERLLAIVASAEAAEDLRMDAAEGLAEIGSPSAIAALRALADEPGELGPLSKELLAEIAQSQTEGSSPSSPSNLTSPSPSTSSST
ncbi:MAG TPA: HEAT repeat domain-containing protein [Myxococcales bacterium]|nr:HEAT repeat domain-containing protein [Myxococcales bacterium]